MLVFLVLIYFIFFIFNKILFYLIRLILETDFLRIYKLDNEIEQSRMIEQGLNMLRFWRFDLLEFNKFYGPAF